MRANYLVQNKVQKKGGGVFSLLNTYSFRMLLMR